MTPGLSPLKNQVKNGPGRREASIIHGLDGIIALTQITDNVEMSYWLHSTNFSLFTICVSTLAALLCWKFPSLSPMPSFTLDLAEITTYKPALLFRKIPKFWMRSRRPEILVSDIRYIYMKDVVALPSKM